VFVFSSAFELCSFGVCKFSSFFLLPPIFHLMFSLFLLRNKNERREMGV
jgi:hypothetical protein